jgi:mxaJ protein
MRGPRVATRGAWFLLASLALANGATGEGLRVCADPNALPYSNARGEGFENALSELLGKELEREVSYVWWPQRRGFLRQLRENRCNAVMGVPADLDRVLTSDPYYRSGYVFLSRENSDRAPESLNSPVLRDVRIGVHLIGDDYANSPPAHALGARGIVENVVGYSVFGDYGEDSPPRTLVDAVGHGDVDVAIVWGPIGGYFRRQQPTPLRMRFVPPLPDEPSLRFAYDMAVGVAPENTALRDEINRALDRQRVAIGELLTGFGIPTLESTAE